MSNQIGTFDITHFGANPDGETLCTAAIAKAIDACAQVGGGTVLIPTGTFLTGPIHLKSNINLHLSPGAILRFSPDRTLHPKISLVFQGVEMEGYSPLIYGRDIENVAVTGQGVLDGQGSYWWKDLPTDIERPRFISFLNCTRILIDGLTIKNSPMWTINPVFCSNITINNVSIHNPADSPNTDGINPESCQNIRITNCHIDVGDDCIAIKAGIEDSSHRVACENITITNCTLLHGHGGVVIGSEISGSIRNVAISNCVFRGTDRGIRIKCRRGRGGVVEDVRVNNLIMSNVKCPFVMNMYYYCGPGGKEQIVWDKNPQPVNSGTPYIRRIHFSNITVRDAHAAAGFFYGLPESLIEKVSLDNVEIQLADSAVPSKPAMMSNLKPLAQHGFHVANCQNVRFTNVEIVGHRGPAFWGKQSQELQFIGCSADPEKNSPLVVLDEVEDSAIQGFRPSKKHPNWLELRGTAQDGVEVLK